MKTVPRIVSVLCVDDDLCIADTVARVLGHAGMLAECSTAALAAAAMVAAEPDRFDVVVTDHRMPERGGLWLAEQLRILGFKGAMAVHCSPLSRADRLAYETLGVSHFLDKPASLAALVLFVQQVALSRTQYDTRPSPTIKQGSSNTPLRF